MEPPTKRKKFFRCAALAGALIAVADGNRHGAHHSGHQFAAAGIRTSRLLKK
jgi:hypothetical protein